MSGGKKKVSQMLCRVTPESVIYSALQLTVQFRHLFVMN